MTVDLRADDDLLFTLIRAPRAWRMRAVERIELSSALWVDRHRSVEAAPLRRLLPLKAAGHTHARLHLPVGYLRQGPLPEMEFTVAERQVFLLPRAAHAGLAVDYMDHLLGRSADWLRGRGEEPAARALGPDLKELLRLVFEFTAAPWQAVRRRWPAPDRTDLLLDYLRRTMPEWPGPATPLTRSDVERMRLLTAPVGRIVRERIPRSPDSAAEEPLLALSQLRAARTREGAFRVLNELRALLVGVQADAERNSLAALQLLDWYAESGLYWQAVVECVVPLDEPFVVKSRHCEPAFLAKPRGGVCTQRKPMFSYHTTAHQLLTVRDAISNHVTVRVGDPNVEIARRKVRLRDQRYGSTDFVPAAMRSTPEVYALSATRADRPYRLWLDIPLRTPRATAVGNWVIYALTLLALVALAFFVFHWLNAVHDAKLTGGDVAVILIPSAVAAALLLVRDTSTLSAEINKRWHWVVAGVLISLWVFTLCLYAVGRIKVG